MPQSMPRYLVAAASSSASRVREALQDLEPLEELSSIEAVLSDGDLEPGWVFLSPGVPATEVARLLAGLGTRQGRWSPVVLQENGGEFRALSLSPGFARPLPEVVERVQAGGPDASLISFRYALGILSRIRHDVNNPLTAALAETQLLLMDHDPESEAGRSLKVVEEQLHRIRDLIALLNALRPPRD